MAFGGVIKLTGEKEYKQALTNINTSLREMSSQMTLVTSKYATGDKSISSFTQKNQQLNSILQKQKTDYENLKSTYDKMATTVDKQKSAHDKLQAEYDEEKGKLAILSVTVGTTSKEYQDQEKKLTSLQKKLDESNTTIGQNENALSKMRTALNTSATAINKTESELSNMNEELNTSKSATEKAGEGFTVLKGIISNLASKAISSAISGIKSLGSAVLNVGKQAIGSYAEYEQLIGGVETLFKDSAKTVEEYANNAYKTAGLSANKYMETVTSFSASLLQGLHGDTAKTAKIADLAITDMSDNANKMGTSMEMIQNAYQGFAKQNYTMLDNLKLGYGGTKTEMLRLVNDAKITNKEIKSLDDVTFDQIIMAIHKIQDNMGITGTTAKEAEKTISGSVASMKSAWENLLSGMANSEVDTSKLVNKFMDSVKTVVKNVAPVVKQSIKGLVEVAEDLLNELYGSKKFNFDSTKVVKNFENAIKKAIDTIKWFIDNKDKFVKAMKLMLAAFVVSKVASWTKALNNGVGAIMNAIIQMKLNTLATNSDTAAQSAHTTAQIAGKTATEVLTAKQAALNAVMSANPIGLVITALTTLISLYQVFKGTSQEVAGVEDELHSQIQETTDATNESVQAWQDLKTERQNAVDTGMSEIAHYQNLYDELSKLTDENGKVKEGYEKRADFILGRLNEALGTEYKMTGNQIDNYKDLASSIDSLMEKKKAQIILESQEDLYNEALKNRTKTMGEILDLQDQIKGRDEGRLKLQDELAKAEQHLIEVTKTGGIISINQAKKEYEAVQDRINQYNSDTTALTISLTAKQNLYDEYTYNIGQYENNMALAHEGAYDKMSNVDYSYVSKFKDADDQKRAVIEDSIKVAEAELERVKLLYEQNGNDIYKQQVEDAERNLQNKKDELAKYNTATELGLDDNKYTWTTNVNDILSLLTDKKREFKIVGNNQVQYYEDGIAVGKPMAIDEAKKVANGVLKEFNVDADAEDAGKDLVKGFDKGEGNVSIQGAAIATARSFAGKILDNLKSKLGINSPSKETKSMGQFLVEGLGLGIEKEKDTALKEANDFGKSVINSMNKGLSGEVYNPAFANFSGAIPTEYTSRLGINRRLINKDLQESNNTLTYDRVYNGFINALSKMKIELDDENMGKFVVKTVSDEIYT